MIPCHDCGRGFQIIGAVWEIARIWGFLNVYFCSESCRLMFADRIGSENLE